MADAAGGLPGPPPPAESSARPGGSSSSGQRSSGHSPSDCSPGRSSTGRPSRGRSPLPGSPVPGSPGHRAPSGCSSLSRFSPGRSPLPGSPGHLAPSGPAGAEGRCDMDAPLPPMVTVFGLGTAAPARMARRGPPGFMNTEYPRHTHGRECSVIMKLQHGPRAGITPRPVPGAQRIQAASSRVASRLHQTGTRANPERRPRADPGRRPRTSRPVQPRAMLAGRRIEPCGCNRAATVCRIHLAPARRPAEPSG